MPKLRLHQLPAREDGRFPVTIAWHEDDGAASHVEGLSTAGLDDATRRELRWYFEDYLDQLYDPPAHQRAARAVKQMTVLGETLFRDLFQMTEDARDLWARLRDHVANTRIEISTGVAEASAIPWELLQDPRTHQPLVLAAAAFVRVPSRGAVTPHTVRIAAGEPLRILLVICRPRGGEDVPFRSVASRLVKGLDAAGRGRISLTVLRPPSLASLEHRLDAAKTAGTPFHLVHFDGHGTYLDLTNFSEATVSASHVQGDGPRGYLVFEDEQAAGHCQYVDGRTLGALLHKHGVAALVLNACQSAAGNDQASNDQTSGAAAPPEPAANQDDLVRAQGSLAQEAIDAGIGAVLAMRYNVYVETAAHYVGRFYELVAAGRGFGTAATTARNELATQPRREMDGQSVAFQDWPVPVVFETNPLPLLPAPATTGAPLFRLDGKAGGSNDALPPPPAIGFIGRDSTLLELDRAFDHHRVVLLHAYAGSGKTTTAVEFARWYRDTHGIDGPIWFDSFQSHRPLARLLDNIETSFAPLLQHNNINWLALDIKERTKIALQVLAREPVLWLWDNVEQVAGFPAGSPSPWTPAEQRELADFLARLQGSQARVLLTSRRDERGWLHDLPKRITPPPMPMRERRLMAAALAAQHGHAAAVLPVLAPLLDWTQGNPMTITVVVGQALRDQLTTAPRIAAYLERLRAGEADFGDDASQGRSRSLGASLGYGFAAAFSQDEQTLLSLLSLFQGLVDAEILVSMGAPNNPGCAAPYAGQNRAAWIALLDRAGELGLLIPHGHGYYTIHPALPWFLKPQFDRAFPNTTAEPPPPLRAWVEAIGDLANFWATRIATTGDRNALAALHAQESNLRHAHALALGQGWLAPTICTMQGLRYIHAATGRWAAWAALVADLVPLVEDTATGQPQPGHEDEWSVVTEYRVDLADRQQDHATALALLDQQVAVNRRLAAPALRADPATLDPSQRLAIRGLAGVLQRLGIRRIAVDDPACLTPLNEAKALCERLDLRREAAIIVFNLGRAYREVTGIRDLDAAESAFRESLDLRTEDDRASRAKCHSALGHVAWDRLVQARRSGSTDAQTLNPLLQSALDAYRTALTLLPDNAHDDRATAHNQIGLIFEAVNALDPAATHFQQAIRHQEAAGNPYGAALIRFNLANLYRTTRRFDDARDYADAALAAFEGFDGRAAAEVEKTRDLIALIERERATP